MSEKDFSKGWESAMANIAGTAIAQINTSKEDRASLLLERYYAITALRQLCEEHGDNNWADSLHLADIIDKHVYF